MQANQTKQPIEMHKKYKTRDGRPVRIICTDRIVNNLTHPVLALVKSLGGEECIAQYTESGSYSMNNAESSLDLIEVQPWDDFKVDDPVLVRDSEEDEWIRRYFAGVSCKGLPLVFPIGCTSWSANGDPLVAFNFCKKPYQE